MAYGIKTLRKKYDESRGERDVLVELIKKRREKLARYTFSDLDSHGKNPYFKKVREQEKRLCKEYYKHDMKLNKLDSQINKKLAEGKK